MAFSSEFAETRRGVSLQSYIYNTSFTLKIAMKKWGICQVFQITNYSLLITSTTIC